MKQIKVSAKYWNELSPAGQKTLSDLAPNYGLQYTKRIITLANKYFPIHKRITPLSSYRPNTGGVFIVIGDCNKILGSIYKGYGIGITESVRKNSDGKYLTIWNNYKSV